MFHLFQIPKKSDYNDILLNVSNNPPAPDNQPIKSGTIVGHIILEFDAKNQYELEHEESLFFSENLNWFLSFRFDGDCQCSFVDNFDFVFFEKIQNSFFSFKNMKNKYF